MSKFKISYQYADNGMEGRSDKRPEEEIEAVDRDHAVHQYNRKHFPSTKKRFDEFMLTEKVYREWGLTIKEV